jgi:mRNA interferase RelE/StbE
LNYKIIIERKAEKEASNIQPPFRNNIDKTILSLSQNPRPHGCKKLTGREGYRIRVGNYRILYTIDDKAKIVVIYRIKIRGESTYK